MELAGSFRYQPAFEIDRESAEELLDLDDIREITDSAEVFHTIIDYVFDDVDAQVIYGEIGDEEKTAKFFLRTVLDDDGNPEDIKVFVPDKQERYPNTQEFWVGFNEEEGDEAEKVNQVESIAENFKTGNIVIIDAAELIKEQQEDE